MAPEEKESPFSWRNVWVAVSVVAFCVTFPVFLWVVVRVTDVYTASASLPSQPTTTHSDLVTTVLAGLTVSVAMLALVVAGLAIWGYYAIRAEATRQAKDQAHRTTLKHMRSKAVSDILKSEARRLMAEESKKMEEGVALSSAFQFDPNAPTIGIGEDAAKVGKPLKEKDTQ